MRSCERCGSLVGDENVHDVWHSKVDDIESTAGQALDTAEGAANVLYQNDISV